MLMRPLMLKNLLFGSKKPSYIFQIFWAVWRSLLSTKNTWWMFERDFLTVQKGAQTLMGSWIVLLIFLNGKIQCAGKLLLRHVWWDPSDGCQAMVRIVTLSSRISWRFLSAAEMKLGSLGKATLMLAGTWNVQHKLKTSSVLMAPTNRMFSSDSQKGLEGRLHEIMGIRISRIQRQMNSWS